MSDNDHLDMSKQRGCSKVDCFRIGITEELWLEELFGETRTFQFLQHADRARYDLQGPAGQRFGTFTTRHSFFFLVEARPISFHKHSIVSCVATYRYPRGL